MKKLVFLTLRVTPPANPARSNVYQCFNQKTCILNASRNPTSKNESTWHHNGIKNLPNRAQWEIPQGQIFVTELWTALGASWFDFLFADWIYGCLVVFVFPESIYVYIYKYNRKSAYYCSSSSFRDCVRSSVDQSSRQVRASVFFSSVDCRHNGAL